MLISIILFYYKKTISCGFNFFNNFKLINILELAQKDNINIFILNILSSEV